MALEIALATGACVVSADSIQIYRHFDIGSAKLTEEQRLGVPHFLIDIADPDEKFNAGIYMRHSLERISALFAEGEKIVVTGGTFLYVRALLYGLAEGIPTDPEFRKFISSRRQSEGIEALYRELESVDPEAVKRINPNDYVRIERALEVYHLTGQTISSRQHSHRFSERRFNTLKIGLEKDRDNLRLEVAKRVDSMISQGLVEEVKRIRTMGYGPRLKPMKSIGYRQINEFLDGHEDLDGAIESTKTETIRFAKRQMTWLRAEQEINWFSTAQRKDVINKCRSFLG